MYAIVGKKVENVGLLLDCGADVEKANKGGKIFRVLLGKYGCEKKGKRNFHLGHSRC